MKIPAVGDRYDQDEIERYYSSGCWATETLGEILARQAAERGDKTFITDGTVSLTYREVHEASLRLAVGLGARGVGAGNRVAVQLPNWAEFAVVAAAIARLGAVMVPIMPIYRRDEIDHVLDDADVRTVVTAATFKGFDHLGMFRSLAAERPALHTILVVRDDDAAVTAGRRGATAGAAVIP